MFKGALKEHWARVRQLVHVRCDIWADAIEGFCVQTERLTEEDERVHRASEKVSRIHSVELYRLEKQ